MGVMRGAVPALMHHIVVKRRPVSKPQWRGSFTKWTRVVAFMAPVPHDHGVENSRLTCLLDFGLLATCPPCLEDGRRWTWGGGGDGP